MSEKMSNFELIAVILGRLISLGALSFFNIWSLNQLFNLNLSYTFKTILAGAIILKTLDWIFTKKEG